jgi:hypothetical protein
MKKLLAGVMVLAASAAHAWDSNAPKPKATCPPGSDKPVCNESADDWKDRAAEAVRPQQADVSRARQDYRWDDKYQTWRMFCIGPNPYVATSEPRTTLPTPGDESFATMQDAPNWLVAPI